MGAFFLFVSSVVFFSHEGVLVLGLISHKLTGPRRRPFLDPLAAILNFAGGAVLQTVS